MKIWIGLVREIFAGRMKRKQLKKTRKENDTGVG